MNSADTTAIDFALRDIGRYLDGKGEKPAAEKIEKTRKILEDAIAAEPNDGNLKNYLNTLTVKWEIAENLTPPTAVAALDPDSWFVKSEFKPHLCATDYLRIYPHVITEYTSGAGTPSQFLGNRWAKDAAGIIKSQLEQYGSISPRQISEAIESICNMTRITDPDKMDLPLDLIMPLPDHTIPITDGLFDMRNKTVTPHTPNYFYTESLPRKYINSASPEIFLKFLDVVFTGDPDAEIKKTQIFETMAWTLMRNYSIQGTVIFYGQGGEGKSIIHDVMANLLIHVSTITLAELEKDKFKRAELYGSWANLISESTTEIITSEWFKRVTDGTQITVDRKNGHPFKMHSHAKMIIDTNELPVKENELRAFYRRVIAIIDFPNMLESVLKPEQINDYVTKLKEPDELDRIFSYVVDNYYGPLVQRMKFTAHLSIADAEKKWQERSNPATAYLKVKDAAGEIITDTEDARVTLMEMGIDSVKMGRYFNNEDDGEHAITIKQDVVSDAVKWATEKGFPAKNINAGTLGKALIQLEYPNMTINKKVGKGIFVKAWRDILIHVDGSLTDPRKEPLTQKVQSDIAPDGFVNGNGSYSSLRVGACVEEGKRGVPVNECDSDLGNSEPKALTGRSKATVNTSTNSTPSQSLKTLETPLPDAILETEKPKFYTYRVLKEFTYNGHVYDPGLEFILNILLDEYIGQGILELLEGQ